jgi:dinuclear metal center YbgI/SA1388 family protein
MKISDITSFLESRAHSSLQEHYDNAGLITGETGWECTGIICSLDATEEVVNEAISKKCNLIIAHHPIIFKGLKKINGKNYVEKTIITAIKNDIAIYAIHTNLDNVIEGVNGKIAEVLGLENVSILFQKENSLKKLFTFVPVEKAADVRQAIFSAGGGKIGNYSECSFSVEGSGTFKAGEGANPFVGEIGQQHREQEIKIEVIFPSFLENKIIASLKSAHPYEEVAYDIVSLSNTNSGVGAGLCGYLPVVRHTALSGKKVKKIALCGGAGSFLIFNALESNSDVFITADLKYHEFFDANGRILIADIGHFESEQFTINLLQEILEQKFPTFAVLKTAVKTNPVLYF